MNRLLSDSTVELNTSAAFLDAVIYARYSSHAQRDVSIEQQLQVCRKYAAQRGFRIIEEYADHAASGTTDHRPSFQRMIADAKDRRFSAIIVYKTDRFARNRYDSAVYKRQIQQYGVRVMSACEDIPEGSIGVLLESVLEGAAEYYSVNHSENVRRGMNYNAQHAMVNNGGLPLGYRKGADGKYEIVPEEAEIVREIFRRTAAGETAASICADLNRRGLATSRGKPFGKNSVPQIIHNERYTGVYLWGEYRIVDGIPAIVTEEEYRAVNKKHPNRPAIRTKATTDYMLSGRIFCGHCGAAMVGESGRGKSGRVYYYYKCYTSKKLHTCRKKPVPKDQIEVAVVRELIDKVLTDERIELIVTAALELQDQTADRTELDGLRADLAATKTAISNILKAIEAGIFTDSTKDRLQELEERRAALEDSVDREAARSRPLTRDQLTFWLTRFRSVDPLDPRNHQAMQDFINAFVSAVYVYDDTLKIVIDYQDGTDPVTLDDIAVIESSPEGVRINSRIVHQKVESEHLKDQNTWEIIIVRRCILFSVRFRKI